MWVLPLLWTLANNCQLWVWPKFSQAKANTFTLIIGLLGAALVVNRFLG
jgi:hypothetical protein